MIPARDATCTNATQEAVERLARLDCPSMAPTLSSCAFFSALGLYLLGDQDGAAARLASAALALRPSFRESLKEVPR